MSKGIKCLNLVKLEWTMKVLNFHDGDKELAAKSLRICRKTVHDYLREARQLTALHPVNDDVIALVEKYDEMKRYKKRLKERMLGVVRSDKEEAKESKDPFYCRLFPTNEYRIEYNDDMINRDWL